MRRHCPYQIKMARSESIMVIISCSLTSIVALNAYLSTPKFIMTLTDLSTELIE